MTMQFSIFSFIVVLHKYLLFRYEQTKDNGVSFYRVVFNLYLISDMILSTKLFVEQVFT